MAWLEVETKIKIKENEISKIRERIKKIATPEKRITKKDQYFAIQKKGYPKKAFRIRKAENEFKINFKKWIKKLWTKNILVKQEFEFKLKNNEDLKNFLTLFEDLNFKKWIKKTKFNETYKHKKNPKISIELNKVKNLGWFIEIEYLCQKPELEKAKKEIQKTISELKIKPNQVDNTGYTKMLWKKSN